MRWDDVLEAVFDQMNADATLLSIYGTAIRMGGVHEFTIPSLEFFVVSNTQNELWEPITVQMSQFTKSMTALANSDRRLRQLFDHDNMVTIQGVTMWSRWEDGGDLVGPSRQGFYGMAARFRFTPIREHLLLGRGS